MERRCGGKEGTQTEDGGKEMKIGKTKEEKRKGN